MMAIITVLSKDECFKMGKNDKEIGTAWIKPRFIRFCYLDISKSFRFDLTI